MSNKPNYYINAVNALSYPLADDLIAGEKGLYIEIVLKFNWFGWKKKVVGIKNTELLAKTGLSVKTLDKYRKSLVNTGLLEVKKGARGRVTEYKLPYAEINNSTFSTLDSTTDSTLNSTQSDKVENTVENNSINSTLNSTQSKEEDIRWRNNSTFSTTDSTPHKIEDKRYLYNNHHDDFSKENFEEENSENQNFEKPKAEEISEPLVETENAPSPKVAKKGVSQSPTTERKKKKARRDKQEEFERERQKLWDDQIDAMPVPHNSERLQDAWGRYRKLKSQVGSPLAPIQAEQQLRNLSRMPLDTAIEQTEKAINGNWTQIFEPYPSQGKHSSKKVKSSKINLKNADYTL